MNVNEQVVLDDLIHSPLTSVFEKAALQSMREELVKAREAENHYSRPVKRDPKNFAKCPMCGYEGVMLRHNFCAMCGQRISGWKADW